MNGAAATGIEVERPDGAPILSQTPRVAVLAPESGGELDDLHTLCVHQLFDRQAQRLPESVAVIDGERQIFYAPLNAWANRVAHNLRAQGAGPDPTGAGSHRLRRAWPRTAWRRSRAVSHRGLIGSPYTAPRRLSPGSPAGRQVGLHLHNGEDTSRMCQGRQASQTKLLCVDDDTYLLDLLRYALTREGYTVQVAARGAEALKIAEMNQPDVVILGTNLQDMDGYSLCSYFHGIFNIPVIMLTARHADEDALMGFSQGADDYISKPFSMQVLMHRLQAVLRRTASAHRDTNRSRRLFRLSKGG